MLSSFDCCARARAAKTEHAFAVYLRTIVPCWIEQYFVSDALAAMLPAFMRGLFSLLSYSFRQSIYIVVELMREYTLAERHTSAAEN